MTGKRAEFILWCRAQLAKPVLWGDLDCSELVARSLLACAGPDLRGTHTAQRFADESPALATFAGAKPLDGDLCMYGADEGHVTHVAVWLDGGGCLSADGATKRIKTLEVAVASGAKVREHSTWRYRRDALSIHRNVWLDALELVCR